MRNQICFIRGKQRFGLESPAAAEVQGITLAAHRQRLSRARAAVHGFMEQRCGLVSDSAPCRCASQIPGKRVARARGTLVPGLEAPPDELAAADAGLRELLSMGEAAAVMRGAPQYQASAALFPGIRLVIERSPMFRQ